MNSEYGLKSYYFNLLESLKLNNDTEQSFDLQVMAIEIVLDIDSVFHIR